MYNITDDVNVEAIFAQADAQQAHRDAMEEATEEINDLAFLTDEECEQACIRMVAELMAEIEAGY